MPTVCQKMDRAARRREAFFFNARCFATNWFWFRGIRQQ
jgi:hypothetical protein